LTIDHQGTNLPQSIQDKVCYPKAGEGQGTGESLRKVSSSYSKDMKTQVNNCHVGLELSNYISYHWIIPQRLLL